MIIVFYDGHKMMKGEGKEDINLCLSYDRLSV